MKSKKWKIIRIRTPQLRKLRTNLRTILRLAISDELKRLRELRSLYIDNLPNLTPSQRKRNNYLSNLSNNLLTTYRKSILNCSCGTPCESAKQSGEPSHVISLGVDMGWVPPLKHWICTKCHERDFGNKSQRVLLKMYAHNPDIFYH